MVDKVLIEIDLDAKAAKTVFNKIENESKKAGKKIEDNLDEKIFKGVKKGAIGAAAAVAAIGVGFAAVIRSSIPAISSFEKIENQLKLLAGSSAKATTILKDLGKFAATTPFQFEDIAQATNKLLSFGISTEVVIDRIKSIGEVSAATNSNLGELALIFGQVRAAGKLTGERLLQFQERAVPIGPALAKSMGVAESSIKRLVSEGKVDFATFEKAFLSLGAEGGRFAGALDAQSRTVGGVLSTLGDNFFQLQVAIGKAFGPSIISSANTVMQIMRDFTSDLVKNGPTLVSTFQKMADIFVITPSKFWASVFGIGDTAGSSAKVLGRLFEVQARIKSISAELEANKDNTIFNSFIGRKGQLTDELRNLKVELIDLEQLRQKFANDLVAGTGEEEEGPGVPGAPKPEEIDKFKEDLIKITDAVNSASLQVDTGFAKIGASFKTTTQAAVDASKKISASIKNALGRGVASSMQLFANNLVNGQNAFEGFGRMILGILGDVAINIGMTAVLAGITIESLFGLQGAQATVAGFALIAIGSVLKALAGGGGGLAGGGAGAGGGGGGADAGVAGGGINLAEETEPEEPKTIVNLTVQGDILDSQDTPRRLADLLNAGFETENVTLKQGFA